MLFFSLSLLIFKLKVLTVCLYVVVPVCMYICAVCMYIYIQYVCKYFKIIFKIVRSLDNFFDILTVCKLGECNKIPFNNFLHLIIFILFKIKFTKKKNNKTVSHN